MKKKMVIIGLVIGFFVALGSICFLFFFGGFPEVHRQKQQYGTWKKFAGYSGLKVFPDNIHEEDILYYYYKSQDTIFSPECQICLETTYEESDFEKEVKRISQISINYNGKKNKILNDKENFNAEAYICEYNWNHCYEYALIVPETQQITYVFLQNVNKSEVKFDLDWLPDHYEEKDNSLIYCIYAFGPGKDEMQYE